MIPSSVSTCNVTIGRVAFGFSAASASGSSAGRATIEERIPEIFIASASGFETERVRFARNDNPVIARSTATKQSREPSREARSAARGEGRGARGDVAAKGQRVADVADRLQAAADAANDDRAIAEDAATNRLVDIHTLDLVAVHLDGVPGEQTGFVDDAVVGYGQLGRRPPDERS